MIVSKSEFDKWRIIHSKEEQFGLDSTVTLIFGDRFIKIYSEYRRLIDDGKQISKPVFCLVHWV